MHLQILKVWVKKEEGGEERVYSTHCSVSTTTTNTSTPPTYLCHNRRSQLIPDGK